jgi:glycine/D-amino acid oxidase-like deaminating enzyme/nitrite reductase/ring-hydroxylating ferredoxin subunit
MNLNNNEIKSFNKPPQSYWIASTPTANFSSLNEDLKCDVAIIGGGITGILCSYFLSKKGVKPVIIEADRILQGTTGHTTAKITSQHGLIYNKIKSQVGEELAKQYADANETAIKMYRNLIKEYNIQCDFTEQSAYVYTQEDYYIDKIQSEVDTASKLGIKATYLESAPLHFPTKAAVRFDVQAQFHPRKFLLSLLNKIIDNGVKIFEQNRIVDIEEENGYTLSTNKGKKVFADKVIIASHYPFYNKHGLYFSKIYPDRSYVVAIKTKEKYPGGMFINAEEPVRSLRNQVSHNDEYILVGGENHKPGQGEDTISHYDNLINFSKEIFTVEDIPYRWSTQDCMTMDGLPYAGQLTENTPNLFFASGYGKWGMTNSMASSIILSNLIVEGKSAWEDVYSPLRITIGASAKSFVVENLNVAAELIKGKLSPVPNDIDIENGEGKVIEIDGQRAGAYRDEKGVLHVVDTTCTHMGCELSWNSAEKSWDCPCHGSRFTYEGDIIEGPAISPLEIHKDTNTIEKLINDDF